MRGILMLGAAFAAALVTSLPTKAWDGYVAECGYGTTTCPGGSSSANATFLRSQAARVFDQARRGKLTVLDSYSFTAIGANITNNIDGDNNDVDNTAASKGNQSVQGQISGGNGGDNTSSSLSFPRPTQ